MPSTYSSRLRLELIADGEQAGTWGARTNVNLGTLLESSIAGYRSIAMPDSNYTLSALNGSDDEARYAILNFTGTLSATREVVVPSVSKVYIIRNQTTQTLNIKTSSGSTRAVPSGRTAYVMVDGTNTVDAIDHLAALTVSGATSLAGLTVSGAAVLSSSLSVSGTSSLGNTDTTNLSYTGTFTGGTGIVNLGSNQFYKDTAGNVGVGVVPSAWASSRKAIELPALAFFAGSGSDTSLSQNMFLNASAQTVYKTTAPIARYRLLDGDHLWLTAPSGTSGTVATVAERMKLVNSTGNLLIGTSSDGGFRALVSTTSNHLGLQYPGVTTWGLVTDSSGNLKVSKDGGERLRITTNGFSKFSNNGSFITGVLDRHEFNSSLDSSLCTLYSSNTGSSVIVVEPALPAGATGVHMACQLNNVRVMQVLANGNLQNTNNSYGAISDARLKENVSPAKSYLERFMRVQYKTFNFIGSGAKQFGVIAQELEGVFPGLVEEVPIFGEDGKDTGGTQKTVKYSVLAQIQGKVIQEQQVEIASLESRLSALEDLVKPLLAAEG